MKQFGENEEGFSVLIIGQGRAGKTGKGVSRIKESPRPRKLFIAPRITNKELLGKMSRIDWPITSAQQLADAYNWEMEQEDATEFVLVVITEKEKNQPSIWKVLRDEKFKGFCICADELAILVSDSEDAKEFEIFIRCVGQNDQEFIGLNHRIKADLPKVTALNVQEILYVGSLADDDELENLWAVSNLKADMDKNTFIEILRSQPKKYNWWDKKPNEKAVFKIYG